MFRNFFSYDGKLMEFLNKTGEIILVNITFLFCCIPVITIGSAITSFYYAMIKSVRRERGAPVREFMASMKRTMARGILLTVGIFIWMALLLYGRNMSGADGGIGFLRALYDVLIVVSVFVLLYIFPVFSRFEMKLFGIVKLSFVMSIRFFPITAAAAVGSAAIAWLLLFKLPIACMLVVPGVWCYLLTFLFEKALLHYTPMAKPGEEQWYDREQTEKMEADK